LPSLTENDALNRAAQAHSQAMAEGDFFSHIDPSTGSTPADRITAAGYAWASIAENIGMGNASPQAAVDGWIKSEGHRANILNPDFRDTGVGYVYDANDKLACGALPCYHYWTQVFAVQKGSVLTPTAPVTATRPATVTLVPASPPTSAPVVAQPATPAPTSRYLPPPAPTAPPAPLVTPMPAPSPLQVLGGMPCTEWYLYLIPLLLPLLILLLLWLFFRFVLGIRNLRYEWEQRKWRCRLFFLFFLLYTLFVASLAGRSLAGSLCGLPSAAAMPGTTPGIGIGVTSTPAGPSTLGTPLPPITPTTGLHSSQNVAFVAHYYTMPRPRAYKIVDIRISDVSTPTLASLDTLVLSQVCDVGTALSPSQKQAIVNWVGAGGKLIIYDSDTCGGYRFLAGGAPVVDYSWLPYNFVTDNPGAQGSSSGYFIVVVNDTMVNSDPRSPYYIDAAEFASKEIGDANVMITYDPHWCGDAVARNVNGQQGFVHAYAFYGSGLIVYNGLDHDDIDEQPVVKLWEQELAQPWDPVGGQRPPTLDCQVHVYGGPVALPPFVQQVLPAPITGGPLWPWLLPLLPMLLLLWLLCRRVRPPVFRPWEKKPRG